MRRLLTIFTLIFIAAASASAHASTMTYFLNGNFFPATQDGKWGTVQGDITISTDENRIPLDPYCTNPTCYLEGSLTVDSVSVAVDDFSFTTSAPTMSMGAVGENSAGAPQRVMVGQAGPLLLIFDINSFQSAVPTLCTNSRNCDFGGGMASQITEPNNNLRNIYSATLVPIPEPSTLSLLGIGAFGLLGVVKQKYFNK